MSRGRTNFGHHQLGEIVPKTSKARLS